MLIIQQPEGAADPLEGKYLIITDAHMEGALFVWEGKGWQGKYVNYPMNDMTRF